MKTFKVEITSKFVSGFLRGAETKDEHEFPVSQKKAVIAKIEYAIAMKTEVKTKTSSYITTGYKINKG